MPECIRVPLTFHYLVLLVEWQEPTSLMCDRSRLTADATDEWWIPVDKGSALKVARCGMVLVHVVYILSKRSSIVELDASIVALSKKHDQRRTKRSDHRRLYGPRYCQGSVEPKEHPRSSFNSISALNDANVNANMQHLNISAQGEESDAVPLLHSLPAPLPLYLAKSLPDLKALDALRRSSDMFAIVFAQHAAELLECLMLATLHNDTVVEIRVHVLLLTERSRWRQTEHAIDSLLENARAAPLDKTLPVEAISITLRTFSFLHSLFDRVATAKLKELYELPHRHSERQFVGLEDFKSLVGVLYDVPSPSPLHWIEEQRGLQSLFRMRSIALLGRDLPTPVPAGPRRFDSAPFSLLHECLALMGEEDVHIAMHGPAAQQQASDRWKALAAPPSAQSAEDQRWASEDLLGFSISTMGWITFHSMICIDRPRPLTVKEWPVFSGLGLGMWSYRRLAEELELRNSPRSADWFNKESSPGNPAAATLERFDMLYTWWALYNARRSK
ncbi:hypothetical protein LTR17_023066 [Elasticomyces elasticus]|nr:hypothetical protein LTR17_023066 [Elasticomyces elasticus]